jgi:hypothetical protein
MPEEYRVWKEQVAAVELKRAAQLAAAAAAAATAALEAEVTKASEAASAAASQARAAEAAAPPVYATQAEAVEAFKQLLADCKVSAVAKMKEVMDLCQQDPRWEALRTQGEKKQALAEYQVLPFTVHIFCMSIDLFLYILILGVTNILNRQSD